MFKGKMVTMAIPERVFLLYRATVKSPTKDAEVKSKILPKLTDSSDSYYMEVKKCAIELQLINEQDGVIHTNDNIPELKNITDFRVYVNHQLNEFRDEQFWKVSNYMLNMSTEKLAMTDNIVVLSKEISSAIGIPVDEPSLRGWRFWASFLGFGFVQDISFIPNPAGFIQDLICSNPNIRKEETYLIDDFLDYLEPQLDIIMKDRNSLLFNDSTSIGLRTLHDLKYLKMDHKADQGRIWSLSNTEHLIRDVGQIEIYKKETL